MRAVNGKLIEAEFSDCEKRGTPSSACTCMSETHMPAMLAVCTEQHGLLYGEQFCVAQ